MKKYLIVLFLASAFPDWLAAQSQNLITNPGFEFYNNCPRWRGEIYSTPSYTNFVTALDWVSPVNTTPDYFNTCGRDSTVRFPYLRLDGFHEPRNGKACAGFTLFAGFPQNITGDYWSEYLETRLASPLSAGHDYFIGFYVCFSYHGREHSIIIATDHIGIKLTQQRIDTVCRPPMFFVSGDPDIQAPPGLFISDTANWTLVSGLYHARGGEQWLTIGRFFTNSVDYELLYSPPDFKNWVSYVLVDDVCVIELENPTGWDTTIYTPQFPIMIGLGKPAGKYLWDNGDTTLLTQVPDEGVYLRQRWTECNYYIDTFTVSLMPLESCLWLPKAFTPNNDGRNDKFGPGNNYCDGDFQNFGFNIYNRWGQLVFQTSSPGEKWDGTFNGKPQEVGVYFYTLQYTHEGGALTVLNQSSPPSGITTVRGDVTLLR